MTMLLPGGALVVSLDFELFWGMRDKVPLRRYRRNILGGRQAVPRMLERFAAHEVHATWATIGFLMCRDRDELRAVLPARRPLYQDPRLRLDDALAALDSADADPAFWFAPDLVAQVQAAPHQEIATHTLSHYTCLEPGQQADDFRADLDAALSLHEARLGQRPTSIVFPRNQVAYLDVCADLGLTAWRGATAGRLYTPRPDGEERLRRRALRLVDAYVPLAASTTWTPQQQAAATAGKDLVEVRASRFLRPVLPALDALEPLRLRRIEQEMALAARQGRIFHLWWHPHNLGADLDRGLATLDHVLSCYRRLADAHGMVSLTMAEAADRMRSPAATSAA